jgi:hypothetical protein
LSEFVKSHHSLVSRQKALDLSSTCFEWKKQLEDQLILFEEFAQRIQQAEELRGERDYYTNKCAELCSTGEDQIQDIKALDKLHRNQAKLHDVTEHYKSFHASLQHDIKHVCNSRLVILGPLLSKFMQVETSVGKTIQAAGGGATLSNSFPLLTEQSTEFIYNTVAPFNDVDSSELLPNSE